MDNPKRPPDFPKEDGSPYHAWFSPKQAEQTGTFFYRRDNGNEVEVSEVSHAWKDELNFRDMIYLGVVRTFVRRGVKPHLKSEYTPRNVGYERKWPYGRKL